jgi:hypothetical protein
MSDAATRYPFLSDEWRVAVRRLVDEAAGSPLDQPGLVVNATITGVPFGPGTLELHSGRGPVVGWEPGHVDDAAFSLTTDYYTAKALVLDPSQSSDALAQATSIGTLKVTGDPEELGRWWRRRIGNTVAVELEAKVRDLTA